MEYTCYAASMFMSLEFQLITRFQCLITSVFFGTFPFCLKTWVIFLPFFHFAWFDAKKDEYKSYIQYT